MPCLEWVIPEKIQTGKVVEDLRTFLKKNPGIFRFVTLPLEIPQKKGFTPANFPKLW